MAQNIKSMAARMADNQSYSVKDLISEVKEQKDHTKGDLIKATLWYAWYKFSDWMMDTFFPIAGNILRYIVLGLAYVLLQVVVLAAFIIVGIPASLIGLVTMPVWYPILLWLDPSTAANIVCDFREQPCDDDLLIFGYVIWVGWNNIIFCIIGAFLFGWMHVFYPMSCRKFFMDKQNVSLKDYDAETQIAYVMAFDSDDERKKAISRMSYQSVEKLWADKPEMHSLILAKWMLCEKWANQLLLSNEEVDWNFLVATAYNADQKIGDDVLNYFIDKMKDPEIGTKARKVFSVYGAKHTLSAVVLKELIALAGKGNENANKALEIYAWREALSPDLLDEVYSTKDEALIKEMQSIAKMHSDVAMVRDTRDNDPEKAQWRQFCELEPAIDPEAQKCMNLSQYSIFKSTGHILDREALKYLLLIAKDDGGSSCSFFKELVEGEFEQIDEQLKAQICTENWRQKVYYQVASAKAEEAKTLAAS